MTEITITSKRGDFDKIPMRKFDEIICTKDIYILPTRRKHHSGYACMEFVAKKPNGEFVRLGGCADVAVFYSWKFKLDCLYPSKIIHLFSSDYVFIKDYGFSDIFVYNEEKAREWYGNDVVDKLKNDTEEKK